MKLKCADGITREFQTPKRKGNGEIGYNKPYCINCGKTFDIGIVSLKDNLKLRFKNHTCDIKETE